jgi:ABC-2 type transport system ATP-binding protein
LVVVEDLKKAFDGFWAVKGISFRIDEGEIFGLLGPNGAGKTTTIRMLSGILRPSGGRALVAGIDVGREPEKVRQVIGYVAQHFSLYEELTLWENMRFFGEIHGIHGRRLRARMEELLAIFNMEEWKDSLSRDLPGGVRRRLSLACALIHDPKVLFLDEPTSGMDPVARRSMWQYLKEKRKEGVVILVTTHYMEEAENCDRLALIHEGEIRAMDRPEKIKEDFEKEKGRVYEVPSELFSVEGIKRVEGVIDVVPHGASLHVIVSPDLRVEELEEALKFKVKPVEPTLEDVFVGLLG